MTMQVQFNPILLNPPAKGGYTLAIWKGPSVTFTGAGAYEVDTAIAQHPDWEKLIEQGVIKVTPPPASKTTKKSAAGAKDAPNAS